MDKCIQFEISKPECISWVIMDSSNSLEPISQQAITWTNDALLDPWKISSVKFRSK